MVFLSSSQHPASSTHRISCKTASGLQCVTSAALGGSGLVWVDSGRVRDSEPSLYNSRRCQTLHRTAPHQRCPDSIKRKFCIVGGVEGEQTVPLTPCCYSSHHTTRSHIYIHLKWGIINLTMFSKRMEVPVLPIWCIM